MPDQRPSKAPPWLRRLGGRIRQARRVRGLTQTDVASPNLTKSFISLLESGRTYPSVGTLVALAERLQTSLALLLLDQSQLPRETALNLLTLTRAAAGPQPANIDRLLDAVELLSADSDDLRAELLLTRGDIALHQDKMKDAERVFDEALAWSRKHRLKAYEPRALARLATVALHRNDEPGARQRLEESLGLFRTTRTLRSVEGCDAMLAYGAILSRQGRTARALRLLQEVAQVAQRQDLPLTLGKAHLTIARTQLEAGRNQPAADALRRAKDAFEAADPSSEVAALQRSLGRLLHDTGALADAQSVLQKALEIQETVGETRGKAATLDELARVLIRLGKISDGQARAKAAFEIAEEHHDSTQRARTLVTLAQAAKAQRRWKQAIDQLREAVDLFRKMKLTAELAETARELGMLLKERGEHAEAADYLAMAISAERGTRGTREPGNQGSR